MQVRRVVTGHNAAGKAVVVADEIISEMQPNVARCSVWSADAPPVVPNDGAAPPFSGPLLPMLGGLHVLILTLPPNFKRDPMAMHTTPSVDCILQTSGESVFIMEHAEVRLQAGDWLISNGVMHDWRNELDEPSVMIGIIYGAPMSPSAGRSS